MANIFTLALVLLCLFSLSFSILNNGSMSRSVQSYTARPVQSPHLNPAHNNGTTRSISVIPNETTVPLKISYSTVTSDNFADSRVQSILARSLPRKRGIVYNNATHTKPSRGPADQRSVGHLMGIKLLDMTSTPNSTTCQSYGMPG